MKKFFIGILIGLAIYPALVDISNGLTYAYPNSKTAEEVWLTLFTPSYGLERAFVGNCTKDVSKNGHGWVFVRRDYFKCGTLGIAISDAIYGEYRHPRNPELEKKACKGCSL